MKNFTLICLFFAFAFPATAQLTGMSPNLGNNNQYINTTITGTGIFIQTGSPSGNLYNIQLRNGGYIIPIFDYYWPTGTTYIIDPTTVAAEFYIPPSAPAGAYDLEVTTTDPWFPGWNQQYFTLPGAFTVSPPDGYITGTAYHDLNNNGIKDTGEPILSGYTVTLMPGNLTAITDVSGNYSFPVLNGSYTVGIGSYFWDYLVNTSPDPLSVTIANANSSGNNFGFKRALVSVTPDFGYRGTTKTYQIVSDAPIFFPGPPSYGNVIEIRVMSSPNVYVTSGSITIIDSFTVRFVMTIPVGTAAATDRDIRIYLGSGSTGYHYLKQQFDIVTPPAFISGTVFFDQNLNKLYDAGEPGIVNAKTFITPDSSIAFTNAAGAYLIGSSGGQQTLSYVDIPPSLVLFTDSASYTFNATGNITGKNFGVISTLPDYSIAVTNVSLLARCNSQQYVTFKVRNSGNTPFTALAWIKRDPLMTFINASMSPSSISNDTIYWLLPNIAPYTDLLILARFALPGVGNVISFTAGASSLNGGGAIQYTQSVTLTQTVFCAYDPNDKQVTPPGILAEHFTLMTDTLEYLIRFQNTGNDTAFNVVILDTLDSNLNFNTFTILGSSHSMKTELEKTGAIAFNFENILLPDSNVNEAGSHGYINYRVLAKSGLADSTLAKNTAYIYFDFNSAVVTNNTFNTLVYVLPGVGPLPVELLQFTATPGKDKIVLDWSTASEMNNAYFTLEKGKNGIEFSELGTVPGAGTTNNTSIYSFIDKDPFDGLQYYRLKQTDFNGDTKVYPPVAVRWKRDSEFLVYPNPSDGTLFLDVSPAVSGQTGELMINDIRGRQVLSKEFLIEKNASTVTLLDPLEYLSAGSYFVNLIFYDQTYTQLLIVK